MKTTEFWPALRLLAKTLDRQGPAANERLNAVLDVFRGLPLAAQQQLVSDALRLSMELPDIYAAVVAANCTRGREGWLSAG